jgi:zona occludens toxin
MAINAYVGLMGHGKTYQVIESLIVPKYQAGFNIITNISGINEEEIKKYILKENPKYDISNFGTIRLFDGDEPTLPDFFPSEYEERDKNGKVKKDENGKPNLIQKDGIVKMGDLIIVDEAWQFWDKGFAFPKEHIHFFRYMRHFVNNKGHTCDLAIITQDITTLDVQIKRLVEMLFVTNKPKMVTQDRYNLTIYAGHSQTRKNLISHGSIPKKYNKDIFPLYKSYSKDNAKESLIDDRVSFWKSSQLRYSIIAVILMFSLGSYYLYSYYSKIQNEAKAHHQELIDKENKKKNGEQQDKSNPNNVSFAPSSSNNNLNNKASNERKISGVVLSDNAFIVAIKDSNNKIKMYNNPICTGTGQFLNCKIDKDIISY